MTIDEIIKKATIEFPRFLNLKEGEELLDYIAEKLPATIRYNASYTGLLNQGKSSKKYDPKISGSITSINTPMAFDNFESFLVLKNDISKIKSLQFILVPDWEIGDYRKEVIQLWGEVRNIIGEYFKKSKDREYEKTIRIHTN